MKKVKGLRRASVLPDDSDVLVPKRVPRALKRARARARRALEAEGMEAEGDDDNVIIVSRDKRKRRRKSPLGYPVTSSKGRNLRGDRSARDGGGGAVVGRCRLTSA